MDFRTAMEHYKNGSASPEERRLIEAELEKSQLIAEYLDAQWESTLLLDTSQTELKQMRKALRRRNLLIVLTSLLLAAALCLGILRFAVPAWEARYWDPNTQTLTKYGSDLTLTMDAYSELFSPTQTVHQVNATRTGFAAYSLSVAQWHVRDRGDISYLSANLEKDTLSFSAGFWEYAPANVFVQACYPEYDMGDEFDRQTRERLTGLPDYIWITAAVSFEQDLSMEELIAMNSSLEAGNIEWLGIRICSMDEQMYPLCGMKPFSGGIVWELMDDTYPSFHIANMGDPEELEAHFMSLLQFSLDRQKAGRGIDVPNGLSGAYYYERALQYVQDNGVYAYGCYLSAPASVFLTLMDSGIASQVWIEDAWIYA